jgi:hypothetical protein
MTTGQGVNMKGFMCTVRWLAALLLLLLTNLLVSCGDNAVTATKSASSETAAPSGEPQEASPPHLACFPDPTECLTSSGKEWAEQRDALKSLIVDVAFQQERPVFEAFYLDANRLREESGTSLLRAVSSKDYDSAQLEWSRAVNAKVYVETTMGFISGKGVHKGQYVIDNMNPATKTVQMRCRPVLDAYLSAPQEIHARYRIDRQAIADSEDRINNLPNAFARYIDQEDYYSAFVAVQHAEMLGADVCWLLFPFQNEIYSKSHPSK